MKKIGVFLSGRGSNFIAIKENIDSGYIKNAKIEVVFSNNPDSGGLQKAREFGLETVVISHKSHPDRATYDKLLMDAIAPFNLDLICLAGYMRLLSPELIDRYENKIINIHPSLLPAFQGLHAQEQAFDYGVKISGCTVHFVDAGLDTGAIILQKPVDISLAASADEVASLILKEEHRAYPEAVRLFCEGKLRVEGRRVVLS